MSASLSGVWNAQEFTDLGALAAGYRLYTYVPSTTTLKTAYTDAAGSVPHTYTSDGAGGQYIALNARGELPAPLFLTSGGYDLTLKTSAGVTVWTRRAIGQSDIGDTLRSDLASTSDATKGAFQIGKGFPVVDSIATLRTCLKTNPATRVFVTGYYAAGDGGGGAYYYDSADTTSIDNGGSIIVASDGGRWKLQHFGSWGIKQFGAKMDQSTDDAAAVQAAHDAAPVNHIITVPSGGCVVGATITISKPVTLRGSGRENTNGSRLFKKSTLNAPMFNITGSHAGMEDLCLVGQAGNGDNGINVQQICVSLRRLNIVGMGANGIRVGDDIGTNCNIGVIDQVEIQGCGAHGLLMDSSSVDAGGYSITNVFSQLNAGDGFHIARAQLNSFHGCVAESNTGYGVNFASGARDNWWFGGDSEGNTAGNFNRDANALRCGVIASWGDVAGITSRATHSGNQSIANTTPTAHPFDQDVYVCDGMHSAVTNNTRMTCTTPGKYRLNATILFAPNATGFRQVSFRVNGTTYIAAATQPGINAGDGNYVNVSSDYQLAAGDYVEVMVYQSSGGALNSVKNSAMAPSFCATRIH